MACSQLTAEAWVFCERKVTGSRLDLIVADNDGTIVQRSVGGENIGQKFKGI